MYLTCVAAFHLSRIQVYCLVLALFNFLFTLSDNNHISAPAPSLLFSFLLLSSLISFSVITGTTGSCPRYAADRFELSCPTVFLPSFSRPASIHHALALQDFSKQFLLATHQQHNNLYVKRPAHIVSQHFPIR